MGTVFRKGDTNFTNWHEERAGSVTAGAGSVLTFFANTDSKKMQD